jgi:hypothetical protein
MEEKFYYTRWFAWSVIGSSLPALAVGFMILYYWFSRLGASQWSNEKADWFVAAMVVFFISAIPIISGLLGFIRVMKPAIVLTNRRIVFSPLSIKSNRKPYFFNLRKLELGFGEIVSARITDMSSVYPFEKPYKVVEVKFRRPSGVEDSFYIFISKIAKKDKLIEILRQRIKFV